MKDRLYESCRVFVAFASRLALLRRERIHEVGSVVERDVPDIYATGIFPGGTGECGLSRNTSCR